MTTATTAQTTIPAAILDQVAERANALDDGEGRARFILPPLGAEGLLGLGAPQNSDGHLPDMVAAVRALASRCMSSAFGLWAHRMTIEYLALADTPYANSVLPGLLDGSTPGITGMASAFREAAGCGSLDLTATPTDDGSGYVLDGALKWASNLYDDSIMVTAARATNGDRLLVALPLSTPGITAGNQFSLMALDSTASSFVKIEGARISADQVLTTDFEEFLTACRPTFLALQSAMCCGLAEASLAAADQGSLGTNAVFAPEIDRARGSLALVRSMVESVAEKTGPGVRFERSELLSMRLAAAEVASSAAALELRCAGGRGYAHRSDSSRRFREAAFIPVQSPSEGQLRWELSQCER
ncbi:acyl-CoA dehydrogenase [Corynebacterium hansenii]|uniref:Acyl-CoA dehydrogenase n=1 Tax=Corynebacterium hansenii TaxID=394964 RepID=A0ABV7ZLQ0_9CORY|nr:acyl-CoA dehydrogenase family protein [Corynebacterium hansenii]WJY98965.1 hypothetical protein CHAN_01650 [Corynebacterium hansenii]